MPKILESLSHTTEYFGELSCLKYKDGSFGETPCALETEGQEKRPSRSRSHPGCQLLTGTGLALWDPQRRSRWAGELQESPGAQNKHPGVHQQWAREGVRKTLQIQHIHASQHGGLGRVDVFYSMPGRKKPRVFLLLSRLMNIRLNVYPVAIPSWKWAVWSYYLHSNALTQPH